MPRIQRAQEVAAVAAEDSVRQGLPMAGRDAGVVKHAFLIW